MLGLSALHPNGLTVALKHVIAVRDCRADLGPTRKSILFAIASRIGCDGDAWPNEETIARDSGASLRSVKRHLGHLRRGAFLLRNRKAGIPSWCYQLGPAITCSETVPNDALETGQSGRAQVSVSSERGANLTPKGKREVIHYKSKGSRKELYPGIDYSRPALPAIDDYGDINGHDPILVAMAITGERAMTGWGHWVKRLRQAKTLHGKAEGEKLFRECLHELFGLSKESHRSSLGAILNKLLKDRLGDMAIDRERVA